MKIALVQLCSFGDCLYATLVARQIKRDYPGSHLTWVIGDKYASILDGNPSIDAVHTIVIDSVSEALSTGWERACSWVNDGLKSGTLDKAFYTQIIPDNISLYDGLIRSTTYRGYGRPVHGPHRPEVYLSTEELNRIANFVRRQQIKHFRHVFLFECGPQSGQSGMNVVRAEWIAHKLAASHDDAAFILSSGIPLTKPTRQVIDASSLTYRDNAALSHYCTGLVGCSSGITWLTTSTAGQLLPMLQILTGECEASVRRDFKRFDFDTSSVIEMADPEDSRITNCIDVWIMQSHNDAFRQFNESLRLQSSTARKWYLWIRSSKGPKSAIAALCRIVWMNGVSTMPWSIVPGEIRLMFSTVRFHLGGLKKRIFQFVRRRNVR